MNGIHEVRGSTPLGSTKIFPPPLFTMLSEQQRKAEIARLKVEARALELGFICSRPVVEGTRYDCIIDMDGRLYRAQIKYCDRRSRNCAGAVSVLLKSSNKQGAARCYSEGEIDILLVYLPTIDRVCLFPKEVFCGKTGLNIRLDPPRNGQAKGCVFAADYFW